MGEANKGRSRAMESLALQIDKYPRDLLQRFISGGNTQQSQYAEPDEDAEEIELNLGLSLGGRFGVDKNPRKLTRSSSIVGTMPIVREDDSITPPPASNPTLIRTSSLPTETEEEWRKRKDLQMLRRMEAKRRRSEKQRNSKVEREGGGGGSSLEEDRQEIEGHMGLNFRDKRQYAVTNKLGSTVASPFGLPTLAAAARQALLGGGIDALAKGKVGILGGSGSFPGFAQPCSQGSVDSQGGSSSGMSEMESKPFQVSEDYLIQTHIQRIKQSC
ncbi:Ninja family [Quillaja saponaria]|uniref:Ninja-family protein n=1 Tax=Quillaja saponaria TaxID=32244 RepID=A0AAD7L9C9_QUISA|nr:Ninja family [Quillaja saponaria]